MASVSSGLFLHHAVQGGRCLWSCTFGGSVLYNVFRNAQTMMSFRNWAHNLWIENCEERQTYSVGDQLTEQEYFQRFKWWLRREWRHQQQLQQQREKINERFKQWN